MSLQKDLISARSRMEGILLATLSFAFSIVGMIVLILMLAAFQYEINMNDVFYYSFVDVFLSPKNLSLILFWATPLLLTGLAVAVAFHAGLFNIGGQGQLILGGCFSAIWGAFIIPDLPSIFAKPFLALPTTILAGIFAGVIWGAIPGLLKAYTGAHEVIVTILMNQISYAVVGYLIVNPDYSPFVDKTIVDAYNQTPPIVPGARVSPINEFPNLILPAIAFEIIMISVMSFFLFKTEQGRLIRSAGSTDNPSISTKQSVLYITMGYFASISVAALIVVPITVTSGYLNPTIFLVIGVAILMYFVIYRTNVGFSIRAVGSNKTASEVSGIESKKYIVIAMAISGGLAGMAGSMIVVTSETYRYIAGSEGQKGFTGIAVALIGQNSPFGIIIAALLFGMLTQGRINLDRVTDVPSDVIYALQAMLVLFVAAPLLARRFSARVKRLRDKISDKLTDEMEES
jgi:simple sugar transport system permease protein